MERLKRVRVLSLAKLHAVVFGFAGLILGILYSFGGLVIDSLVSVGWVTSTETPGLSYGTALAFLALVGMPAILAFYGFLFGAVVAFVYNFISGIVGGKKIDFLEI